MDRIIKDEILGKRFDKADLMTLLSSANSISQVIIESDDIEQAAMKELTKIKRNATGILLNFTAKSKDLVNKEIADNIVESFKAGKDSAIMWDFKVDPKIDKQYRLNIIIGKK
ncbi:MAG: hypothetical protein NTU57_00380 [Candidatus Aenigmarchaeota archaeon]|nr:hypothetical protein [Candidatus Aenigmarchaeota archaeon]